jgi:hypothetical protein|tara:strand:- start:23 stop:598 length:576 start_codon:yes stop_codon:yes gene_type:complete
MEKQAMGYNQKKVIIDKEITSIYPALVMNSEKICSYMADSWSADLLTIVIEYFLKMDIDKQYQIVTTPSKKASSLEKYLTKCMALSVKSSTSPFYRTYRMRMYKHRELIPDFDYSKMIGNVNPDDEDKWGEQLESLHSVIATLDFYDRYLIDEHYFKGQRIEDISNKTQIHQQQLSKDIKKALKKLKLKLQ